MAYAPDSYIPRAKKSTASYAANTYGPTGQMNTPVSVAPTPAVPSAPAPAPAPAPALPATSHNPTGHQPAPVAAAPAPAPTPTAANPPVAPPPAAPAGQFDPIGHYGLGDAAGSLLEQARRPQNGIHIASAQHELYKQVEQKAMAALHPQIGTPEQVAAGTHISYEQAAAEAQRQAFLAFDALGAQYQSNPFPAAPPNAGNENALFPEFKEPNKVDQNVQLGQSPNILYTQVDPKAFAFGYQDFMPDDLTATKTYQLAEKEGTKALERLLAARGLTGSGAEIDAHSDMLEQLLATETEKHREYADRQAGRATDLAQTEIQNRYGVALQEAANELQRMLAQGELDQSALSAEQYFELQKSMADNAFSQQLAERLGTFMIDGANRDERQVDRSYDQMHKTVSLMLSQLPIAYAYGGTQGLAGLFGQEGNALASWLTQIANASGQGGGGGGSAGGGGAPLLPPTPGGPDYSNITPIQIQGDQNSAGNWANTIWNSINSLWS